MPESQLTELALRSIVNATQQSLAKDETKSETIKETALQCSANFLKGNTNKAQTEAITLALEGILLAYQSISKQITVLNKQRLSFDQERQSGIATFVLPNNIEERDLSSEEKAIKDFIQLAFRHPSFATYLGIHEAKIDKDMNFYSILPFYKMSEALGQPLPSRRPLDRQRASIHLFLKSAFPDAIANIDTGFQTDYKFISFWESVFHGRNYLNDRRAPRFIMMSLSNIVWSLLHCIDPETGFPLNNSQVILICRDVEYFINQLLDPDSPPYLQSISNSENSLISFLRQIEISVKSLRAAYAEDQLHELNIDEITYSSHRALRIIDKNVFKLIYKRRNPVTSKDEPDDQAADKIAQTIDYLNQLLMRNEQLMEALCSHPDWIPKRSGLNTPPTTVMDVLIIFCHLPWRDREKLLTKIEQSKTPTALEFAQALKKFNMKFIEPIKAVSKKELNATIFNPKHQQVGILTASRLIPLLALVIQDQRIEVDTKRTMEQSEKTKGTSTSIYTGKEQIHQINLSAQTEGGYYKWTLSPFVTMSANVANGINELPKRQCRMTQLTELLDDVSDIIKHYRNYLQNPIFQGFLLKLLHKVKAENIALELHIDKIDTCLSTDEYINRSLKSTLHSMTKDINSSLETFSFAISNLEQRVKSPDLTEQERKKLSVIVRNISDQFSVLFAEDSGISELIEPTITPPKVNKTSSPLSDAAESKKVVALLKLVQKCYNALSYQSQIGQKGLMLRKLLNMIESNPQFTEHQIKHVVMELTRITASYRETLLFQAAYGQTRSAKALVEAIKDPRINSIIPLASIIFDHTRKNMMMASNEQILIQLREVREKHQWQESNNNMQQVEL